MVLDMSKKIRNNDLQILINTKMMNQSFEDVAKDMDLLVKTVDRIEARHDYEEKTNT